MLGIDTLTLWVDHLERENPWAWILSISSAQPELCHTAAYPSREATSGPKSGCKSDLILSTCMNAPPSTLIDGSGAIQSSANESKNQKRCVLQHTIICHHVLSYDDDEHYYMILFNNEIMDEIMIFQTSSAIAKHHEKLPTHARRDTDTISFSKLLLAVGLPLCLQ